MPQIWCLLLRNVVRVNTSKIFKYVLIEFRPMFSIILSLTFLRRIRPFAFCLDLIRVCLLLETKSFLPTFYFSVYTSMWTVIFLCYIYFVVSSAFSFQKFGVVFYCLFCNIVLHKRRGRRIIY